MTDLLDEIDDVIADWHGSVDSATWTAPWDEPVIEPGAPWRQVMDREGWDGYAAAAYPAMAVRVGIRALPVVMARFNEQMKPLAAALTKLGRALQGARQSSSVLLDETRVMDSVMAGALNAQKARNTGPAPRRLDGRRAG